MAPALAAKEDNLEAMNIVSDHSRTDLVSNRTEVTGNVVLTRGTMVLRAESADIRQPSEGTYQAFARGTANKQVTFHEASDTAGESIEGSADQVEYDSSVDVIRFIGNAWVRQLRGEQVASEVRGATIVFNKRTEICTIEGGDTAITKGRARLVLMPRAASGPAAAASAASSVRLQPSQTLQQGAP